MEARAPGARLLPFAPREPAENMAIDEALLRHAAEPTLRFYAWDPHGISLGYFQRDHEELASLLASGMPVVRRLTGGGAIVHAHELTYSLTLPLEHPLLAGRSTRESYAVLHQPIVDTLRALGVPISDRKGRGDGTRRPTLCFHRVTDLDLVVGERKLAGSAQRRTRGRLLQHGSIVLRPHPLQPGTASVEEFTGALAPETLAERLGEAYAALLGPLREDSLTGVEFDSAAKYAPTCVFS